MFNKIKTISIDNKNYPARLKQIKNPPKILYYIGNFDALNENCFGIVGPRIPSVYGKQTAINFANDLCSAGLIIVSGLANGIDTVCHQTVVEKNKITIAVLGNGLDEKSFFPKSNLKLAKDIIENNGCLVSEYPPNTRAARFTFPNRNKIISGLSLGVLIIEARQRSGALITAEWAKKQNRKIFAIPGSIYSETSKGCNALIKQGANLTQNANDILKELKLLELNLTNNNLNNQTPETEQENLILQSLKEKPIHIDEIIEITKLDIIKINSILSILEIDNKIKNLGNNVFCLI